MGVIVDGGVDCKDAKARLKRGRNDRKKGGRFIWSGAIASAASSQRRARVKGRSVRTACSRRDWSCLSRTALINLSTVVLTPYLNKSYLLRMYIGNVHA